MGQELEPAAEVMTGSLTFFTRLKIGRAGPS
jgi:hypothetical protein